MSITGRRGVGLPIILLHDSEVRFGIWDLGSISRFFDVRIGCCVVQDKTERGRVP